MAREFNTLVLSLDPQGFVRGAARVQASNAGITRSSTAAVGGLRRLDTQATATGRSIERLGSRLGAAFGFFSIVSGVNAAVDALAGVERQFSIIKAISRDLADNEFQDLRDRANEIGATTEFTTSQAAAALVNLGRAGFNASEQLSTINSVVDLATVGQITLAEAASTTANTLRQFGLFTTDATANLSAATRVVDSLTVVTNNTNTTITELGRALKFVGPVAGAFGVSLEETSATLGLLANAGITASLAGTNLRGIIAALAGPTRKARTTLEELNVSTSAFAEGGQTLTDIFQQLRDAEFGAEEALAIFNRRNAGAALLIARNLPLIEELKTLQEENAFATRTAAQIIRDDLRGAFDTLRSSAEAAVLVLGDAGLRDALNNAAIFATQVIRELAGITKEGTRVTVAVEATVIAIKALAAIFAVFVAAKIAITIVGITKSLFGLLPAINAVRQAFLLLFASNPFTILIAAVAAAVGAFAIFKTETLKVEGTAVSLGAVFQGTWNFIVKEATTAFNQVRAILNFFGIDATDFIKILATALVSPIIGVPILIAKQFGVSFEDIQEFAKGAVNFVIANFKTLGQSVTLVFNSIVDRVARVTSTIGQILQSGLGPRGIGRSVQLAQQLVKDLDGIDFAIDVGRKISKIAEENFATDFVGGIINGIELGAALFLPQFKKFVARLGDTTVETLKGLNARLDEEIIAAERQIREARAAQQSARADKDRQAEIEALLREQRIREANQRLVKANIAIQAELEERLRGTAGATDLLKDALEQLAKAQEERASVRSNLPLLLGELLVALPTAEEVLVESIASLSGGIASAAGDLARDLRDSEVSVRQAFTNFVTSILDSLFEALVATPIERGVESLLSSALGGIFGAASGATATTGTPADQNAAGTVFTGPTVLPTFSGPQMVGETRAEGLFPLVRDQFGRLAISTVPSGREDSTQVTINQTVIAQDQRSFRRTSHQQFTLARREFAGRR